MTDTPVPLPPNTIRAHIVDGADITPAEYIRPAKITRDWMDAVPGRFIYRCIPLIAANSMGWELLNPAESRVIWDGGAGGEALSTITRKPGPFTASSHFGSGIVTWYVPFLFRTSPDLGLYITGPANHGHDDAVPLDAFVRTDWLPFPFTMNWRLTRADHAVTFAAGEPIARIMPFPLAMLDETTLEITTLAADPAFAKEVAEFGKAREKNRQAQQENARLAVETGEAISSDGVWNGQYVKARGGEAQDGFRPHQTVFRPQAPIDKR